jgi:glycosyltransferase involved in cell wall biosynthesis
MDQPSETRRRLLFVIHRFGREIIGGAEKLALEYAQLLVGRGYTVTVVTTCAVDYMTWANELSEGTEAFSTDTVRTDDGKTDDGKTGLIEVLRFPTDYERDVSRFNRLSNRVVREFKKGGMPQNLSEQWMQAQGPVASKMTEWVKNHAHEFDAVFVFNYLYYNSWQVMSHVADKAVLVPFAHDEWPLGIPAYRTLFSAPAVLGYSSQTEYRLIRERFAPDLPANHVWFGAGYSELESTEDVKTESVLTHELKSKYFMGCDDLTERGFVLLLGRISENKGTVAAANHWIEASKQLAGDQNESFPYLLIAGPLEHGTTLPSHRLIKSVPHAIPETDAVRLRQAALATLHCSPHESLNLEALASVACRTPLLVSTQSEATLEVLNHAGFGLSFGEESPAPEHPSELYAGSLADAVQRIKAAQQELTVASTFHQIYSWDAVANRLEQAIQAAITHRQSRRH